MKVEEDFFVEVPGNEQNLKVFWPVDSEAA